MPDALLEARSPGGHRVEIQASRRSLPDARRRRRFNRPVCFPGARRSRSSGCCAIAGPGGSATCRAARRRTGRDPRPADGFRALDTRGLRAPARQAAVQADLQRAAGSFPQPRLRGLCRDQAEAGGAHLGRRDDRLRRRAAPPRLSIHQPHRPEPGLERQGLPARLRHQPVRFRQASPVCQDRRHRLLGLQGAFAAGHERVGRDRLVRWHQLLSGARRGPGRRADGARARHQGARSQGRGDALLPRDVDREAERCRRPARGPRRARLRERHRRLPLHDPPRRGDDHGYGMHAVPAPRSRQLRPGVDERDPPARLYRPRQVQRLPAQCRGGLRPADADRCRRVGLAPGQQSRRTADFDLAGHQAARLRLPGARP